MALSDHRIQLCDCFIGVFFGNLRARQQIYTNNITIDIHFYETHLETCVSVNTETTAKKTKNEERERQSRNSHSCSHLQNKSENR